MIARERFQTQPPVGERGAGGSDEFQFTTVSDGLPGVVRRFRRFSDAAREAGLSRIYGGIHFPSANEGGLQSGEKVGKFVACEFLQPLADRK